MKTRLWVAIAVSSCAGIMLTAAGCAVYAPVNQKEPTSSSARSPHSPPSMPDEHLRQFASHHQPASPLAAMYSTPATIGAHDAGRAHVEILWPRDGDELVGVRHMLRGRAEGDVERVEVWVRSRTGDYQQGILDARRGLFVCPIHLGEALPGRGEGEYFEITCRALDGDVSSDTIRVFRVR